jgi:hypothetical protein
MQKMDKIIGFCKFSAGSIADPEFKGVPENFFRI